MSLTPEQLSLIKNRNAAKETFELHNEHFAKQAELIIDELPYRGYQTAITVDLGEENSTIQFENSYSGNTDTEYESVPTEWFFMTTPQLHIAIAERQKEREEAEKERIAAIQRKAELEKEELVRKFNEKKALVESDPEYNNFVAFKKKYNL